MSAYINRTVTETTDIPMNRWVQPSNFTIHVKSGTWTFKASLDQVNRGDTAAVNDFAVINSTGAAVTASSLTAGIYKVENLPVEMIRATRNSGTGEARIMQNGSTGG